MVRLGKSKCVHHAQWDGLCLCLSINFEFGHCLTDHIRLDERDTDAVADIVKFRFGHTVGLGSSDLLYVEFIIPPGQYYAVTVTFRGDITVLLCLRLALFDSITLPVVFEVGKSVIILVWNRNGVVESPAV